MNKYEFLTINAIAESTGIDRRTLQKRLGNTKPARESGGTKFYRPADVLTAIKGLKTPKPESPTADLARKKLQLQIKRLEIENAKASAGWVQLEDVKRTFRTMVISAKMKFYQAETTIQVEAGMKLAMPSESQVMLRQIIHSHHKRALAELYAANWGKIECPLCKGDLTNEK